MNTNQIECCKYTIQPDIECNPQLIKKKDYETRNTETPVKYTILNYDSWFMSEYDEIHSKYRSVILSSPENEVLCFSPPKSLTLDNFRAKYMSLDDSTYYANELIEGTMINLFYDKRVGHWQMSTKNAIGGNYWYFRTQYNVDPQNAIVRQPTFLKMFMEAMNSTEDADLNSLPILEYLDKTYSYSFVLQHPSNHIVLTITRPTLYLVAVYESSGNQVKQISPLEYEKWAVFIDNVIEFPKCVPLNAETSYESILLEYGSENTSKYILGVSILNLTNGERTKIENPVYNEIRELRGNNPNLQYQYLCLKRMNKVIPFLEYFGQYKKIFYRFYRQYVDFLTSIHKYYFSYYIAKEGIQVPKKFFRHIYKIHHEIYLPSLEEGEKKIIKKNVVDEYLMSIPPSELLYSLNHNLEE
jgi:hypothetical protein